MTYRQRLGWTATAAVLFGAAISAGDPPQRWTDRFAPAPEAKAPSAGKLVPLRPRRSAFTVTAGDGQGTPVEVRLEKVDDPRYPYRRHTPGGRTAHLRQTEAGAIVVGAIEDERHNALTRYRTELPLIPADPERGEPIVTESKMVIYHLNDRDRVKDRGECTQKLVYHGPQRVTTPAGRFVAHRFSVVYRADLSLAQVKNTSRSWYAPGRGLIAQYADERISAFLLNEKTKRRMVLQEPDQ